MPTEVEILERLKFRGLNPAEWEYDPAAHGFKKRASASGVEVVTQPPAPLLSTQPTPPADSRGFFTRPLKYVNRLTPPPNDTAAGIAAGVYNAGAGAVESMTSPLGIGMLPLTSARVIGLAPKILAPLAKTAAGYLGYESVTGAVDSASKLHRDWDKLSIAEKAELSTLLPLSGVGMLGARQMWNVSKASVPPGRASAKVTTDAPASSPEVPLNSIAPGEKLSIAEAAEAARGSRANPVFPDPNTPRILPQEIDPVTAQRAQVAQEVRARKLEAGGAARGQGVAEQVVKSGVEQNAAYSEAVKRLTEAAEKEQAITLEVTGKLVPIDPVAIEAQARSAGFEPATQLETLSVPDKLLGDPVAAVKRPIAGYEEPIRLSPVQQEMLGSVENPMRGNRVIETQPNAFPTPELTALRLSGTAKVPREALKPLTPEQRMMPAPSNVKYQPAYKNKTTGEVFIGKSHEELLSNRSDVGGIERGFLSSDGRFVNIMDISNEALSKNLQSREGRPAGIKPRVNPDAGESGAVDLRGVPESVVNAWDNWLKHDPWRSSLTSQEKGRLGAAKRMLYQQLNKYNLTFDEVGQKMASIDASRSEQARIQHESSKGIKPRVNPNAGESGAINLQGVSSTLRAFREKLKDIEPVMAIRAGNLPFLESQIATVRRLGHAGDATMADALQGIYAKRADLQGKYEGAFRQTIRDNDLNASTRAYQAGLADDAARNHNASNALDPKAKDVLDSFRNTLTTMARDQIASGQPIKTGPTTSRQRGVDPYYFPRIASQAVIESLAKNKSPQLRQDFIDQRIRKYNMTPAEAELDLNNYVRHYDPFGGNIHGKGATYGAVRKVEGMDIPDSWVDPNPFRALTRYARNFARDRAHFDVIEKNPDVMHMLGMTQDYYGNPVTPTTPHLTHLGSDPRVTRVMDEYLGFGSEIAHPVIRGVDQLVRSTILGLTSKIGDNISVIPQLTQWLPDAIKNTPGMAAHIADLSNISTTYGNAVAHGLIKPELTTKQSAIQLARNLVSHHETLGEVLSDSARLINGALKHQDLEVLARLQAQAGGEFAAKLHNDLARAGDPASIKFMRELLGKDWQNAGIEEIGSRVGELVQGTYDARNLPAFSPGMRVFTSMSRWAIEQANHSHGALTKAWKGDASPLIALVGTGLLAGAGREWLLNKSTGMNSNIPTSAEVDEAAPEAKNKMQTYRTLALLESVGVGGIATTMVKGIYDAAVMKMNARGFSYPTYDVIANSLKHTGAATGALMEGESPFEVLPELTKNLVVGNSQSLKFLQNIAEEHLGIETPGATDADKDRRQDFRNKRMYEVTQGKSLPANRTPSIDYSALPVRKFKRTTDVGEAAGMIPELMERAVRRADGDPNEFKRELTNLRSMPLHNIPSPETSPQEFAAYITWLTNTRGEEYARDVMNRYGKQRAANKVKKELIAH